MYIPHGFGSVTPYFFDADVFVTFLVRGLGDRQGGVRDAMGNIWWVSQRLVEAP